MHSRWTWSETPLASDFDGTLVNLLAQTPDGRPLAGTLKQDGAKNHTAM